VFFDAAVLAYVQFVRSYPAVVDMNEAVQIIVAALPLSAATENGFAVTNFVADVPIDDLVTVVGPVKLVQFCLGHIGTELVTGGIKEKFTEMVRAIVQADGFPMDDLVKGQITTLHPLLE
jgi:hypothetical protein